MVEGFRQKEDTSGDSLYVYKNLSKHNDVRMMTNLSSIKIFYVFHILISIVVHLNYNLFEAKDYIPKLRIANY